MPQGPAARFGDPVVHATPPTLAGSPGSLDVLIGNQPAWRGLTAAGAAAMAQAVKDMNKAIAEAPEEVADEVKNDPTKAPQAADMIAKKIKDALAGLAKTMATLCPDLHACALPTPNPHGPEVVMNGSQTVLINNFSACRMGDILQGAGPTNTIALGFPTVIIGDSMFVGQGGALAMAAQTGAPFCEH